MQSLMLSIAKGLLEEEERQREEERQDYMASTCPQVSMPRTLQELQVLDPGPHSVSHPAREPTCDQLLLLFQDLCREIHRKIEQTDEERYDLEMKVTKSNKEVRPWGTSRCFYQGKP